MKPNQLAIIRLLVLLSVIQLLSACQGTMRQIKDCKLGDWSLIGNKDGENGLIANYEERRQFCANVDGEKIKAESAVLYQTGWVRGNYFFWNRLGQIDGAVPRPSTYFNEQANSEKIRDKKTPINQLAYSDGWALGNANYWRELGNQDGENGQSDTLVKSRQDARSDIAFNTLAYQEGWRNGNQSYWTKLGYNDARVGTSNSVLFQHVEAAQRNDVLVREDAYQMAWNTEIVAYWKRTAWDDATSGWDVYMRRIDAKKRNVKFVELEYQAVWEQRLQQYWHDAGKDDGFGKPNRIEERMVNARQDRVFVLPNTKDIYMQAWTIENMRFCGPENAFSFGRSNAYFALDLCPMNMQVRAAHALESGQKYEAIVHERHRVERDLNVAQAQRNEVENRLRRLERDVKKDRENKDRASTPETVSLDKKREQERVDLVRLMNDWNIKIEDLERWRHRYQMQLERLQNGI